MKAITPLQARRAKTSKIPAVVIKAVNMLIAKNLEDKRARIFQEELIQQIMKLNPDLTSTVLFDNSWLDVEPIFEKQGWKVEYDKPGYGDDFEAYFIFTAKRGTK